MTLGGLPRAPRAIRKPKQLLAQARAALGGEKNLDKVQGLTAAGTYQREMGDRQLSGEITIDLQLPDKMLRTESMSPMGDATIEMLQGVNGEQVLRHSRTIGGGAGDDGPHGTAAERRGCGSAGAAESARRHGALRAGVSPDVAVGDAARYTYGGEAEAEDGKADVVDAKGPGSFAVRLFFDKKTHRPLMLSYRGAAPRMVVQTQRGDGPPPAAPPAPGARCRRRRSSTSSCSSTTTRRWTASCCRTISRDRSTGSRPKR